MEDVPLQEDGVVVATGVVTLLLKLRALTLCGHCLRTVDNFTFELVLCALHLMAQWGCARGRASVPVQPPAPRLRPSASQVGALTFLHLFCDCDCPPPGAVARKSESMRLEWTHFAVTCASWGDPDWGKGWGSVYATPGQVEAGSLPSQADRNVVPSIDSSSLTSHPPPIQG